MTNLVSDRPPRNARLLSDVSRCQKCPDLGGNHCAAIGPPTAEVMFLMSAPFEKDEWKHGIIACGDAGDLFTYIIDSINVDRDAVYVTGLVKCAPQADNGAVRKPTPEEVRTCYEEWLQMEIQQVQPKVIVTVGKEAWFAMTPDVELDEGHTGYRHGHYTRSADWGCLVLCCYDVRVFLEAGDIGPFVAIGDQVNNLLRGD